MTATVKEESSLHYDSRNRTGQKQKHAETYELISYDRLTDVL